MEFANLVKNARTRRRYHQDQPLSLEQLLDLVDLARITPSGGNMQPLRYGISVSTEKNAAIYPQLTWAATLKDWDGPSEGERPTGYIIIGAATPDGKTTMIDLGIAAQTIQLGAQAMGLGCCMLVSIKGLKIQEIMGFPEEIRPMMVLALGYPVEEVVLEPLAKDAPVAYWRDANKQHHVPKRALEDIVLAQFS